MKISSKLSNFLTLVFIVLFSACTPNFVPAQEPPAGIAPTAEEKVLNIFNWVDYMDEDILSDFEEEFGITVNLSTYGSNEELIDLLEAGSVEYDIVVPSDYAVEYLRNKSFFGELDKNNIPNIKNIDPAFINPIYDPGSRYCIPYQWGTTGIGYNINATGKEIQSWDDVFDPAFEGRISMQSGPRETLGAILIYLGYSPNTTNPLEINEAVKFLKSQSNLIAIYAPDTGDSLLAAGEVDIAHEYSGDILSMMPDNPDIRYVIPEEGAVIWVDSMCLLANAHNKKNAELFMNYILEPEVGAALSNYIKYATPNQAALPFISKEDLKNPGLYPSGDVMARLFIMADVGQAYKLYEDAWNDVLANHDQ